jgi:hypothetical protein
MKAVEAELAALRPRDDRLDRERLIFLAGQASVAGRWGRVSGWTWPASFAGMTAVAATLLVMLLARPEPPVRIVEVPVEAPPGDVRQPEVDFGRHADFPAGPRRPDVQPWPATDALASHRRGLAAVSEMSRYRSRTEYLAMVERILAQGADPWAEPHPAQAEGNEPPAGPRPYRQWLKTLLDDQARAEPPRDWPHLPVDLHSGVNS